jgi:hypothetical protein
VSNAATLDARVVECGVLLENPALEVSQHCRGLDSELGRKHLA